MEFNPNNPIVRRCIQGMDKEADGKPEQAHELFLHAWNEAANDFEKYLAAYYLSRHQHHISAKLHWLQTALQFALKVDRDAVRGVFPALYNNIAKCYEDLHNIENAQTNYALAISSANEHADKGPFYHGTRADLQIGDELTAGNSSNYQAEVIMNHIYFTAMVNGAGLAAALAKGDQREHIYIVEPTGSFENDPNVTDKKFPGNPTRSYRTQAPLKIIGEITEWERLTPEQLKQWRERLANSTGKIIN